MTQATQPLPKLWRIVEEQVHTPPLRTVDDDASHAVTQRFIFDAELELARWGRS